MNMKAVLLKYSMQMRTITTCGYKKPRYPNPFMLHIH